MNKTPTNVYLARQVLVHVQQVNNENSWANVDQNLGGSALKFHWSLSKFEYDEIKSGEKDKEKQRGKNAMRSTQQKNFLEIFGENRLKSLSFCFLVDPLKQPQRTFHMQTNIFVQTWEGQTNPLENICSIPVGTLQCTDASREVRLCHQCYDSNYLTSVAKITSCVNMIYNCD